MPALSFYQPYIDLICIHLHPASNCLLFISWPVIAHTANLSAAARWRARLWCRRTCTMSSPPCEPDYTTVVV
jgi:hypothetical protein